MDKITGVVVVDTITRGTENQSSSCIFSDIYHAKCVFISRQHVFNDAALF